MLYRLSHPITLQELQARTAIAIDNNVLSQLTHIFCAALDFGRGRGEVCRKYSLSFDSAPRVWTAN